jgi:hypothetical protein
MSGNILPYQELKLGRSKSSRHFVRYAIAFFITKTTYYLPLHLGDIK